MTIGVAAPLLSIGVGATTSAGLSAWTVHHVANRREPHPLTSQAHPLRLSARRVPLLGGAAVLGGFVSSAIVTALLVSNGIDAGQLIQWCVFAVVIAALGAADDLQSLPVRVRLGAEIVVVLLLLLVVPRPMFTGVAWLDSGLVALAMLLVLNGCNLLDNSDWGLPAPALVASLGAGLCLHVVGDRTGLLTATALAGGLLGFAHWNRAPAQLFLGDSGSLLVGSVLASLAVVVGAQVRGLAGIAAAAGLVLVPVCDSTMVVLSRISRGLSPLHGGVDHLAHRLQRTGLGASAVPGVLATLSAIGAAISVGICLGQWSVTVALAVEVLLVVSVCGWAWTQPSTPTQLTKTVASTGQVR